MSYTRRHVLSMLSVLAGSVLAMSTTLASAQDFPKVALKTNMGDIVIELHPEAAPKTVENFIRYVKAGHYNGTIFHRVIDNFMVQGGGFDKNMKEKSTNKPIVLEAKQSLEAGWKNEVGTVAMARTNDPNSATAQFFINVNDNEFLNHQTLPDGDPVEFSRRGTVVKAPRAEALSATAGYAVFGKVISGMDVVTKIKSVETSSSGMMENVPNRPVIIESAKLIK